MTKYSEMIEQIRKIFSKIHIYMEVHSADYIRIQEYDPDNTAYILKDVDIERNTCSIDKIVTNNSNFSILNTAIPFNDDKIFSIIKSTTICFIPIDGKNGVLGGRSNCDFIFFNKKDFCFVELKLNATVVEERPIRKNRKKAIDQLKHTINFFDEELNKNYLNLNLEAYVATPSIYPRENTAWQSLKVEFLEQTGIILYETDIKTYL